MVQFIPVTVQNSYENAQANRVNRLRSETIDYVCCFMAL